MTWICDYWNNDPNKCIMGWDKCEAGTKREAHRKLACVDCVVETGECGGPKCVNK